MALGPTPSSPPPPAAPTPALTGRLVAFTTPPNYLPRLARLLSSRGAAPLPVPTVSVCPTPEPIRHFLRARQHPLEHLACLAFTSRAGISAFSRALDGWDPPPLLHVLRPNFVVAALGKDAELLYEEGGFLFKLCEDPNRVRILVPDIASPAGLVKSLGPGYGRQILCPVPSVVDLTEPPVIPDFLNDLEAAGWIPVRIPAYEMRWVGAKCAEVLVTLDKKLDALLFTSTAEVEGLLKGLEGFGWDWAMLRRRWPEILVGAHGPVTAKGAEMFGVDVDVVSKRFDSFNGILDALELRWRGSGGEE